jgi:acyl-coenzyme A thioesterase PaaI-like protein
VTAHARREDVPDGVAAALRREPWARELGIDYLEFGPGHDCRVALALKPEMLNHQGTSHGGVIFSHRVGSP